jgi:HK97 family phage major capsid protein
MPLVRAAGESTNVGGGFLVPTEIANSVISLREKYGAFRRAAQIAPMGSDTLSWPRRTGGISVSFLAEGATPAQSTITFDNFQLVAKKLGGLVLASSELDQDAAIDLGNFLAAELAYAFSKKEDECGFLGDGTSTYGGIRGVLPLLLDGSHAASKVAAATGHDTLAEVDATDLGNLIATVSSTALPGARFFVSQYGFGAVFSRLAASSGGILMMNGAPTFLGFPIEISQALPNVGTTLATQIMLLFGDLSRAATLGDRRVMSLRRSDQRYFDSDQVGFLGIERIDIVCHDLGDNTSPGPIVGLQGTA